MPKQDVYQCTVYYSGRVQGVGFRYHTLQIAREFEVSGTVRNLSDGRVELVAEGDEAEVRAFLAEVAGRLAPFIRQVQESAARGPARHSGFHIR